MRVSASFTLEAAFVMGIVIIVIFLMISKTLEFNTMASEFAEECIQRAKVKTDVINSMRLERLVGKIFDK